MRSLTRRRFLEDTLLAAAAAAVSPVAGWAEEKQPVSPSNRLRAAIIGCRVRGQQHAQELSHVRDCEIVYVCDPDPRLAAELAAAVEKQQGKAPKTVPDLRRVFDDPAVDAVFIATPNHWHALAAIWAMQAGKDVYVEKPVSHNLSEGRRLVQVARKTGRICQPPGPLPAQRQGPSKSPAKRAASARAARRTAPAAPWRPLLTTSGRASSARSNWRGASFMARAVPLAARAPTKSRPRSITTSGPARPP